MEYPRNPPAPKEQLQPQRPSMSNVYTPGFTIEGGRTGLTHEEYLRAIRDHSPLVESCLNKTRWWVLSTTILSGISAMFVAKRTKTSPCRLQHTSFTPNSHSTTEKIV